jgi:hypothetical protein
MIRFLLDYQFLRWLISIGVGAIVFRFFGTPISKIHYSFTTYLPGTLLSLAGFIITAAAIVVSLRDQGLLKIIADNSPKAWNNLMSQFYRAARYAIFYRLFLFFFDIFPLPSAEKIMSRFAYALSVSIFTLVLIQLLMAIKALEDASYISSKSNGSNKDEEKKEVKSYKLPDTMPNRIYGETSKKQD